MRFFYILLLTLAFQYSTGVRAQGCGTPPPTREHYEYVRDVVASIDVSEARNTGTTCVPIQAHIVRADNGLGGLTQVQLNNGLAFLNYYYLNAGIEFYWKGVPNYANNTDYYTYDETGTDVDTEAGLAALFPIASNAINIFFTNALTTTWAGNLCGYASYPSTSAMSNRIYMKNSCMATANGAFVHEVGHYFDLFHTHEYTEQGNTHALAENVPRTGAQANCATDGDLLCDTEADPKYTAQTFNSSTCTYTGGASDINGVQYAPPVTNIMSYYPDNCGTTAAGFTPQQYVRIAQGLVERNGHTSYSLTAPAPLTTAPANLSALLNGNNVQLSWTPVAGDLGYLVERSTTSSTTGFRALIYGGTAINASNYNDLGIPSGTVCYYRVKASNGACNTYSNVVTVNQIVQVSAVAFLEGPFDVQALQMTDSLRTHGLLPTTEPYTALGFANVGSAGGEATALGVFNVAGGNAIVDWVRLELRSASNPATILATKNALVQRDGDVVSTDGVSPVSIATAPGTYFVAIRHRNHLGVMTALAVTLSTTPTIVDFTSVFTAPYGTNARKVVGTEHLLWAGDANSDGQVKYTGTGNDRDPILTTVGSTTPNNSVAVYNTRDVNMNGAVKYTGSANDRDPILVNIGSVSPNAVRVQQLP